jgi:hypothetical protein
MKVKKIIINFLLGYFLIFISFQYSFAWLKHLSVKLVFIDNKLFFIFSKPQEICGIDVFLHDEFKKIEPKIWECRKLKSKLNDKKMVCPGIEDFKVWSIGRSADNDNCPKVEKIEYGQEVKGLITDIKAKELKKNVKYEFNIGSPGYIGGGTFIITEDNKLIYPADKVNVSEKYSPAKKDKKN